MQAKLRVTLVVKTPIYPHHECTKDDSRGFAVTALASLVVYTVGMGGENPSAAVVAGEGAW